MVSTVFWLMRWVLEKQSNALHTSQWWWRKRFSGPSWSWRLCRLFQTGSVNSSASHQRCVLVDVFGRENTFHPICIKKHDVLTWEWLVFVFKVSVLLYHGPQPERMKVVKQMRQRQGPLKMCPVVVTSFEIAMKDRKFLQVNSLSSCSYSAGLTS